MFAILCRISSGFAGTASVVLSFVVAESVFGFSLSSRSRIEAMSTRPCSVRGSLNASAGRSRTSRRLKISISTDAPIPLFQSRNGRQSRPAAYIRSPRRNDLSKGDASAQNHPCDGRDNPRIAQSLFSGRENRCCLHQLRFCADLFERGLIFFLL